MDKSLDEMTLEELVEAIKALPEGPPWSKEETLMSTPYSDVESWLAMLIGQTLRGGSRLMGPPGLREEVEHQLSSSMAPEMISWLLERTIPTGKTLDGWVAGFMERATKRLQKTTPGANEETAKRG